MVATMLVRAMVITCDPQVVSFVADLERELRWINGAAGHVVSIFQGDERGLRPIVDFGTDRF